MSEAPAVDRYAFTVPFKAPVRVSLQYAWATSTGILRDALPAAVARTTREAKMAQDVATALRKAGHRSVVPCARRWDDGSFVIEVTLPKRRLGISFEPNDAESGWFFVDGRHDELVQDHGTMATLDLGALARRLR